MTKIFWDAVPESGRIFVADPSKGSKHNRGSAVDLTLYELATGKPVKMVGGYDEFSPRSFPDYPGGTSLERWHRGLLQHAMEAEGFTVFEFEWWHFDYRDWAKYPILNRPFRRDSLSLRNACAFTNRVQESVDLETVRVAQPGAYWLFRGRPRPDLPAAGESCKALGCCRGVRGRGSIEPPGAPRGAPAKLVKPLRARGIHLAKGGGRRGQIVRAAGGREQPGVDRASGDRLRRVARRAPSGPPARRRLPRIPPARQ